MNDPVDQASRGRADCLLLIPYHEAPDGLIESLRSVGAPAHRIVVLVVDDGSVEHPAADVLVAREWPFPVLVETLPTNLGIEHALNHGLRTHAHAYTYVARLDCGDLCTADRFVVQLEELDNHPALLLLGGAAEFVSPDGRSHVERYPLTWSATRRRLRVNSAFVHPGVVFRSSVIDAVGTYPTDRPAAEDYAYFWSIAETGEARNLPDVVVRYVLSPDSISTRLRHRQIRSRLATMLEHFRPTPLAVWGILRSLLLYPTPRALVVAVRRRVSRPESAPSASRGITRVLHVTQPTTEGTARVVYQLAGAGIEKAQHVTIACPADGTLSHEVRSLGADWIPVPMERQPSVRDVSYLLTLRRLMATHDLVVLHSSKAGALGRMALLTIPQRRRPKSVFMPHAWSWQSGGRLQPVYRAVERILRNVSDSIVAVSATERSEGLRVLGSSTSIRTIPNGIDLARFTPGTTPRADAEVVVVGRLSRQKGQDLAIRAVAALPDVRLVLVGDGPDRDDLETLAQRLGVASRTWLVGAGDPLPSLQRATVVIVPSRWEGLPLVLLEAMATAAAVVATEAGAAGTLGGAGWVVGGNEDELPDRLASAIRQCLASPAERARRGALARELVLADHGAGTSERLHLEHWDQLLDRGTSAER